MSVGPLLQTLPMDLIRIPAGWAYPGPGPCDCGATTSRCGWEFCRCANASGGGHTAWRCKVCDAVRTLGCSGAIAVTNEYGGRSGANRCRPSTTTRSGP